MASRRIFASCAEDTYYRYLNSHVAQGWLIISLDLYWDQYSLLELSLLLTERRLLTPNMNSWLPSGDLMADPLLLATSPLVPNIAL